MRTDAGIRVQLPVEIYLGSRSKGKKSDKQMHFIVRVITRYFILKQENRPFMEKQRAAPEEEPAM